ncbi:hypothetical protein H9N25_11880 [Pedobacter riviphilus]|uniref:Lipoprotein n=1 Tax=Pedobacter riviphilus TaxID=2766984 RepID=A0ABX6TQG1_9SPHI|nr:hypothetical protein [Pedobacter riviphilus]QNR87024.1 hypothetical protein H9N25_11880 [Pedobacter riviphilus]
MRKIYFIVLFMLALSACKRKTTSVKQQDKDLMIQVKQEDAVDDSTKIAYQVRIFNQMKLSDQGAKKIIEVMAYGQDSSFYKLKGLEKIYPVGVVPVANGIKNCFEYVVLFDKVEIAETVGTFVFSAKNINGKTYQLRVK